MIVEALDEDGRAQRGLEAAQRIAAAARAAASDEAATDAVRRLLEEMLT
jgi:hypothetical protein